MANSSVQRKVEECIREEWMPQKFHCRFSEKKVQLITGGQFKFDAVSDDESIVALISTSSSVTATQNKGRGQMNKVRSDALYLMMLGKTVKRKMLLFSEANMFEEVTLQKEKKGRIPAEIELHYVPIREIREDLADELILARKKASEEMRSSMNNFPA